MKTTKQMSSVIVRAMLILGLVFGLTSMAEAQPLAAKGKPAAAKAKGALSKPQPATAAKPSSGQQEGIKVHGHWTIEVRNPDGTLVSHAEFENALTAVGPRVLASILSRKMSTGYWYVELTRNGPGTTPCFDPAAGNVGCLIVEANSGTASSPWVFNSLVVDMPTSGVNSYMLVLSGTATASASSFIDSVITMINTCSPSTAPALPCPPNQLFRLTSATIPAVNVSPGQIIQVTVVISFS